MKKLGGDFAPWVLLAAVLFIAPMLFTGSFALTILSKIGVFMIFAVAYNMLLGQGGMLSFGHAVYFGMAGYFTVHFINSMHDGDFYFPISLLPLFGGLVGLVFGVLIGYVSTRRAGTTFAMISLGFGEMFTALTLVLVAFFNGEEGIQTDRWVGPEPFGITFGPAVQVYYLIAIWCLIATIAMYWLTRTPFGRVSNAVRDNPERAQFVGYNTQRVRWLAFSLSSFFAGLAGALHALNFEHIGFETVSAATSGLVLFMVYIGGVRNYYGPIIGAVLISYLEGVLSELTAAWPLYFGIVFIVVVMFAPGGIAGLISMHGPIARFTPDRLANMAVPYIQAIGATIIAAAGAIGLMELIFFLSEHRGGDNTIRLYWTDMDATALWPWLVFGVIFAAGFYLCRLTYPKAADAYSSSMAEVRARMLA